MMVETILGSPIRRLIVRNTIAQLGTKLVSAGAVFFISILVASRAGASGYGDFTKITTYASFFFLAADFGLNAVMLQKKDTRAWWQTLFTVRTAGSVFLVGGAILLLGLFPRGTTDGYTPLVRTGIALFAPTIFFQSLLTTANAAFQRELRYDYATAAVSVGAVVSILLAFFLMRQTAVPAAFAGSLSILAGSFVMATVSIAIARRLVGTLRFSWNWRQMRELIASSTPLGITLLFTIVLSHADSVILTLFRATNEVGIYGLAYKVFEVPLVIPTFVMNATYPLLLKARSDRRRMLRILRQTALFLGAGSVLAAVATWFGAPLLPLIRGDFSASIRPLRILSLSFPLFFISAVAMWGVIALQKQAALLWIYGAAMAANVVLNLLFVSKFGYLASAWITLVTEAIVLVALLGRLLKTKQT